MASRGWETAERDALAVAGAIGAERRRRRVGCVLGEVVRPMPLSPPAHAAVVTALEGERRAHAFHAAVTERFPGAMPFRLTVEAEARHVAAIEALLRRRGLTVPTARGGATTHRRVPSTLGAACLEAVTAKEESIRVFERVLVPLVAGQADVERVFRRIVEAARERHVPALRHWADDHHRLGDGGERI